MRASGRGSGEDRPGRLRHRAHLALAALLPLAVFLVSRGPWILDPESTRWLASGDSAQHFIGWTFFAREGWGFPPGRVGSWPAPLGTTIGLTDSIPLLAFPLKLLAGASAAPLQYFGFWCALCVALTGWTAGRFLELLGTGRLGAALGGATIGLSPVLWDRLVRGHQSLAAVWLLLATFIAWSTYFRSGGRVRALLALCAVPVVAAAVHPYLALMAGAFAVAAAPVAGLRFGWRRGVAHAAAAALAGLLSLGVLAAAGFLAGAGRSAAHRWGGYRADLASLLDSAGRSRFVPRLLESDGAREGFSYLGLGVVGLAVVALGLALVRSPRHGAGDRRASGGDPGALRALWIASAALALLGTLPRIEILGREIVDVSALSAPVESVLGVFRANGRFLWPLHFLIAIAAIRAVDRRLRRPVLVLLVLAPAAVVQALEPELPERAERGAIATPQEAESWRSQGARARRAEMVPPHLRDGVSVLCGPVHDPDAWVRPAFLSAAGGMTFNSGYVARLDAQRAHRVCAESSDRFAAGRFDPGAVYLVRPGRGRRLRRAGWICAEFSRALWRCRVAPPSPAGRAAAPP